MPANPILQPLAAPVRSTTVADAAMLAAFIAAAGVLSIALGQDSNWDLQNYHFYNPWAWLEGRIFGVDLAAAQLQTFHNPLLDLPFYAMVATGWPPRAIAFALAVPAGMAAFFLVLILRHLFADLAGVERRVAIVAAFAIGVTGAMGRATLGTTMNEWPLAALVLGGVWLVVRALVRRGDGRLPTGALVTAGALFGIATGAKLTAGTFAVTLALALVLRGPATRAATFARVREAFVFGSAVLAGFAVAYGPWAIALWTHYGSPIFPYGNEWIRSPWWAKAQVIGRRYGPFDVVAWLRFPFDLYSPKPFFVAEVEYRDVRMPLLYGTALVCGAVWLWMWVAHRGRLPAPEHRGVSRAWRFVVAFFILSFLLWTAQHSNYRYLVTLDLLSGALLMTLLQRNLRPGHAPAVMIAVAAFVVVFTQAGSWGRVPFRDTWFDVRAPRLEPNALVVFAVDAPMAHVIPFLTPTPTRVVGIDNGIVNALHNTRLEDAVNAAIRTHDGPLYALTDTHRDGAAALSARGLSTVGSTCAPVRTHLVAEPLKLCRVERASSAMPGQ